MEMQLKAGNTAVPAYEHECNPPPVNISRPECTRWFCPDCGTGWLFARRRAVDGMPDMSGWFPLVPERRKVQVGVPVAKLRQMAEQWDDLAREFYYDNRHTHPEGIGYASGYEEGWEHAAELLRKAID